MTITVGTGPKNAGQDAGGRRRYTWQGRPLPSVTTVPKLAGMPERLHRWFVGNLIDHVIKSASAISLRTSTGDDREISDLRRDLWRAVRGDQNGRIVGIAVHRAASEGHDVDHVHPEIAPKLRQYLDWREKSGIEVLASEFQVWNLTEGYAGTVDLLVRFPNGQVWILDLKTGKGLYAEHALQLMAYLMAEFVGTDDVVDEYLTGLLQQVSGIGVLHLADKAWEFLSLRPDPDTWTAYRGLLRYTAWLEANDNLDSLTVARRRSDAPPGGLHAAGWHWARIGTNYAHFVAPHGDQALCFRPIERGRRMALDAQPPDRFCERCASRLAESEGIPSRESQAAARRHRGRIVLDAG